ncbi:MAG: PDZ domain-containing protein [Gammaproteobacteria bacterium]
MKILTIVSCALMLTVACAAHAQTSAKHPAPAATQSQAAQQQLQRDQEQMRRDQQKLYQDQQSLKGNQQAIDREQNLRWLELDQHAVEHDQRRIEQDQQSLELNQKQLEKQMQQARQQMEQAAQRMAELSLQMQGPMLSRMSRMFDSNRAVLGVSIAESRDAKNAQGVRVLAVTPGGPADQAGLRAGDSITAINGTVLRAGAQQSAADQLMDFMDKVKPGDTLKLSYVRADKPHSVTLKAGKLSDYSFAFDVPPPPPVPPVPPVPPLQPQNLRALFPPGWWGAWGDMQLTQLTSGLGQYFGTSKGLLVVRAPHDAALKLQDGDVILKIGDREPATPAEAMRILHSYAPGEPLKLGILRKGKTLMLDVTTPKAQGPVGVYQPMHLND